MKINQINYFYIQHDIFYISSLKIHQEPVYYTKCIIQSYYKYHLRKKWIEIFHKFMANKRRKKVSSFKVKAQLNLLTMYLPYSEAPRNSSAAQVFPIVVYGYFRNLKFNPNVGLMIGMVETAWPT